MVILGFLLLALDVWGLLFICRAQHRTLYRGRSLALAMAIGIVLGVASEFANYRVDQDTRIVGFPLPYAVFQRQGDHWDDFVGCSTLPCLIGNFLIGLGLPLVVLALLVMRKKRRIPGGTPASPDSREPRAPDR